VPATRVAHQTHHALLRSFLRRDFSDVGVAVFRNEVVGNETLVGIGSLWCGR
jgi:hypothetical protein